MGNDMSSVRKSEVVYKVERTPDQTTYVWHGKKHFVPPKVDNATPAASKTTPTDSNVDSCPFCAGVVYANEYAEGQQKGVGPKASSFSQSASAKIKVFHSKKADTSNANTTYATESLPKNFNITTHEDEQNVAYKNKKDFYDQFHKDGAFPESKSATWSKQVNTPGSSKSDSKKSSQTSGEATKANGAVFVEDLFPSIRPSDRTTSFHTSNASSSYVGSTTNEDGSDVEVEEGELNPSENAQKEYDLENSNWKEENLCAKHKHLKHWFRQGHYGQSIAGFRKEIENLIAKKDSGVNSPNDSFESDKKDTLSPSELDLNGRNRITSADSGVSGSVFVSPSADNTNQFHSLSTASAQSTRKRNLERSHEELFEEVVENMECDPDDELEAAFSCFEKQYYSMCNGDLRPKAKVRHTSLEKGNIKKKQNPGVQTMPKSTSHAHPQAPPRTKKRRGSNQSDTSSVSSLGLVTKDSRAREWSPEVVMESILENAGCEADDFQDFFLYHTKALGRPVHKAEVSCSMTKGVGIGEKAFVKTKTRKMDLHSRSVQTKPVVIEEIDEEDKFRRAQSPPIGKNESVTAQVVIDGATVDKISLHEFNTLERQNLRTKPGQDPTITVEEPRNYTERVQEWCFDIGSLPRPSRGEVVGQSVKKEREEKREEAEIQDTETPIGELGAVEEAETVVEKHKDIETVIKDAKVSVEVVEEATQTEEVIDAYKPSDITIREPKLTETVDEEAVDGRPEGTTERVQEWCCDMGSLKTREKRAELVRPPTMQFFQETETKEEVYKAKQDPSVSSQASSGYTERREDLCYDQGSLKTREQLNDVVEKPVMKAIERQYTVLKTTAAQTPPTYFPLRYENEVGDVTSCESLEDILIHEEAEVSQPEIEPTEVDEVEDDFAERVHESHIDFLKTRDGQVEVVGEPDTTSFIQLVAIKNENPTNFTIVDEKYVRDTSKQQFSTLEKKERTRPQSKVIEPDTDVVLPRESISEPDTAPAADKVVLTSESVQEPFKAGEKVPEPEKEPEPSESITEVTLEQPVLINEKGSEPDEEPTIDSAAVTETDVKGTEVTEEPNEERTSLSEKIVEIDMKPGISSAQNTKAEVASTSAIEKVTEVDKQSVSSKENVPVEPISDVKIVTEVDKQSISSKEKVEVASTSEVTKDIDVDKHSISSKEKVKVEPNSHAERVAEVDKLSVSSEEKVPAECISHDEKITEVDKQSVSSAEKVAAVGVEPAVISEVEESRDDPIVDSLTGKETEIGDAGTQETSASEPRVTPWNEQGNVYVTVEGEHFEVTSPREYSTLERKLRTKPRKKSASSDEGDVDTYTERVEESHYDLGMGSLSRSKKNGKPISDPITRIRVAGEVFGEPDEVKPSTSGDNRKEYDLLDFYRKVMQEEEKSLEKMLSETRSKSPSPEGNPTSIELDNLRLTTSNVESQADLQNYINIALASIQSAKEKIEKDIRHARQVQQNMRDKQLSKQSTSTSSLPGARKVNPFEMCKPPAPEEKAQATYLELDPLHPDNVDLLIETLTTPTQSPTGVKSLITTTEAGKEQDAKTQVRKTPSRTKISVPVAKMQYITGKTSPKPIRVANFRTPLKDKNKVSHERTEVIYEGDQAKPLIRRGSSVGTGSRQSIDKISREATPELTENLSYHRSTSHPEPSDLDKLSRVINEQFTSITGKENYKIDADKSLKRRKLQKPKLSMSKDSNSVIKDVALFKKAIQPHNPKEGVLVCEEIATEEVTLTIKYPKGVFVPTDENIFRDIIHHRVTKIRGPSEEKENLSAIESSQESDQKDSREDDSTASKSKGKQPVRGDSVPKKSSTYTC